MRLALAIACAAFATSEAACTLGPTETDGGTTSSTTTATPMTLGDQCDDVITPFCGLLPMCAISVSLAACIANYMPLCCTGSACTATSTVSQATVTACAEANAALDCNTVVNTTNPAACLTAQ